MSTQPIIQDWAAYFAAFIDDISTPRINHALNRVVDRNNCFVVVDLSEAHPEDFLICKLGEDSCGEVANLIVDEGDVYLPMCVVCKTERDELIEMLRVERQDREPRRHSRPCTSFPRLRRQR